MFSTPSIRINNQENAGSVMRKPLLNSTRKAFGDRSVNRVNQLLKNTPINKPKLNLLQALQTPEVKQQQQDKEAPTWMTSMSMQPPRNDMDMIEFSSKLLKAKSRPVTPSPEPITDFEYDFELMRFPPTPDSTTADVKWQPPKSPSYFNMDDDFEFLFEKPYTNFDY